MIFKVLATLCCDACFKLDLITLYCSRIIVKHLQKCRAGSSQHHNSQYCIMTRNVNHIEHILYVLECSED